uniref:Uncharacterized protein n=1 Tax=Oryza nivara TaxID=4536 RepID=A0A0E0GR65_ORYNI
MVLSATTTTTLTATTSLMMTAAAHQYGGGGSATGGSNTLALGRSLTRDRLRFHANPPRTGIHNHSIILDKIVSVCFPNTTPIMDCCIFVIHVIDMAILNNLECLCGLKDERAFFDNGLSL